MAIEMSNRTGQKYIKISYLAENNYVNKNYKKKIV